MTLRTTDYKKLEEEYKKPGSQIVVFYGREGCDQHLYVKQFLRDKRFFYYQASKVSSDWQKKMFVEGISAQFPSVLKEQDYEGCFSQMARSTGRKFIFVVDEFQLILKNDETFFESLVKLKEKQFSSADVMILLCSSAMVWIEEKLKDNLKQLYGQIDCVHKLLDWNFLDVVRAFPDYSVSQSVELYGILGGIPGYLRHWDAEKSTKENICRQILSPEGALYGEAERYISTEIRELSVYNTILVAIAGGNRKLNDLYNSTGFSRAKISVYLKNLMELEVIEKVVSFETGGWDNAQKGIYQIKDTFINFWFKFVFPYRSELVALSPSAFYNKHIAKGLEEYLNRYFIQVCVEYMGLLNQVGKLPIKIKKIGTWIGKQGNIDIIAQNEIRENIVGLCNWSEEKMTFERYQNLEEMMAQARIKAKQYFLFSAKEFDEALVKKSKEDSRFVLIDMTEL